MSYIHTYKPLKFIDTFFCMMMIMMMMMIALRHFTFKTYLKHVLKLRTNLYQILFNNKYLLKFFKQSRNVPTELLSILIFFYHPEKEIMPIRGVKWHLHNLCIILINDLNILLLYRWWDSKNVRQTIPKMSIFSTNTETSPDTNQLTIYNKKQVANNSMYIISTV